MDKQLAPVEDVQAEQAIIGAPTILGKAHIVRAFYAKGDVAPLWSELHERCQNDHADAGAFMDLSIMLHCMGQRDNARQFQAAALEVSQTFVIKCGSGRGPKVLVFVTAGDFMANTPIEFLLERSEATIILQYVDQATVDLNIKEPFDFGFIGISEYGSTCHAEEPRTLAEGLAVPGNKSQGRQYFKVVTRRPARHVQDRPAGGLATGGARITPPDAGAGRR